MTKNVSTLTHILRDHGVGVFKTGAALAEGRPYVLFNTNNSDLPALTSAYSGGALDIANTAQVNGADWYAFADWNMAVGYALDGDTAQGNAAIAAAEAILDYQESLIESYIGGNNTALQANWGDIAYDRWLGVEHLISDVAITYDLCYDLLTPTQRARWMRFVMQATYILFKPADGVWHGASSSRDWVHYSWAIDPPIVTSNYHHHFVKLIAIVGLAFEGEPAHDFVMQGGPLSLDGQYFIDELTNVQLPAMVNQFDKLVGGGSMEGVNYGLALYDLYVAKMIWTMSKGTNLFSPIDTYLEETASWRLHCMLPNRSNEFLIGAGPNNEAAAVRDTLAVFYHNVLGAIPTTQYAPEIKLLTTEIIDIIPHAGYARHHIHEFLTKPAMDSITQASDYSALPLVHSAALAGDNFLRTSWNNDGVLLHVRSGEIHNGSHAHADGTAFQLYKNGYLFSHGQSNWSSLDYDYWSSQSNALDRADKALCSIVGVGSMYEYWPNGNDISEELTGKGPVVHYCTDYTGTDGSLAVSVDAAGGYTDTNPTMQKMQRDFELLSEGVLLIFDRIETSSTETLTVQFNSVYDPTLSGSTFTVNNGVSSAEVTPLNYSPTWTKTERSTSVRIGDGLWQTRGAAGSGTATSLVTAVNIDGAATSIVMGSGNAGEVVVVVTLADTTVKTYTFYETQQLRSVS
jgi:hypothetical protein